MGKGDLGKYSTLFTFIFHTFDHSLPFPPLPLPKYSPLLTFIFHTFDHGSDANFLPLDFTFGHGSVEDTGEHSMLGVAMWLVL